MILINDKDDDDPDNNANNLASHTNQRVTAFLSRQPSRMISSSRDIVPACIRTGKAERGRPRLHDSG